MASNSSRGIVTVAARTSRPSSRATSSGVEELVLGPTGEEVSEPLAVEREEAGHEEQPRRACTWSSIFKLPLRTRCFGGWTTTLAGVLAGRDDSNVPQATSRSRAFAPFDRAPHLTTLNRPTTGSHARWARPGSVLFPSPQEEGPGPGHPQAKPRGAGLPCRMARRPDPERIYLGRRASLADQVRLPAAEALHLDGARLEPAPPSSAARVASDTWIRPGTPGTPCWPRG